MNGDLAELEQRMGSLQRQVDELKRDKGTMAVYLQTLEPQIKRDIGSVKNAILTLVDALSRVAHGTPHLSAEEQAKIKHLLAVG